MPVKTEWGSLPPKNPMLVRGKDKIVAASFCKHYAAESSYATPKVSNSAPSQPGPSCLEEGVHELFNSPFTLNEYECALRKTKTGKSPGPGGILPEFLVHLGPVAKRVALKLVNYIWSEGAIPDEWRKAEIIPIHKKGKPANLVASFRPIASYSRSQRSPTKFA